VAQGIPSLIHRYDEQCAAVTNQSASAVCAYCNIKAG